MARYVTVVESAAALAAGAPFANVVPGAAVGYKLRRVVIGVRAGAGVPTSQQVTVGITRATARGTATTTQTPNKMDPNSPAASITGVDVAWSANPTFTATPAAALAEPTLNTQSGYDMPWELMEELFAAPGVANGLVFYNVGSALPASHLYVVTIEHEE